MITVKLVSKGSGNPIKGKKVALGMEHLMSTGVTRGEWTNSDGEANFNVKPGHGKVYVDGSKRHEGHLSGRIVVYI
jgi:hypothetical protein